MSIVPNMIWPPHRNSGMGPFEYNGNLYTGYQNHTDNTLRWLRSTDGGTTWTQVLSAPNNLSVFFANDMNIVRSGNILYTAYANEHNLRINGFDMETETNANVSHGGLSPPFMQNASGRRPIFLAVRSNGDFVVFYNTDTERLMGTNYRRVAVSVWNGASWSTSNLNFQDGLQDHFDARAAILGASDRVHLFYDTQNAPLLLKHRTYASTLQAEQSLTDMFGGAFSYSIGQPAFDGTEVSVPGFKNASPTSDREVWVGRATSVDAPTWTTGLVADVEPEISIGTNFSALVYDGAGVLYAFYVRNDNGNIEYVNDQGTGSWTTPERLLETSELDAIPAPGSNNLGIQGLAWEGSHLWNVNVNENLFYKMDLSGAVVDSFATPNTTVRAICFDGTNYWSASITELFQLNPSTMAVQQTVSTSQALGTVYAMEWDGQHFWVSGLAAGVWSVHKVLPNGTVVDTFGREARGIAWDGSNVWESGEGLFRKLDANGVVLDTYPTVDGIGGQRGMTWVGQDLYSARNDGLITIYTPDYFDNPSSYAQESVQGISAGLIPGGIGVLFNDAGTVKFASLPLGDPTGQASGSGVGSGRVANPKFENFTDDFDRAYDPPDEKWPDAGLADFVDGACVLTPITTAHAWIDASSYSSEIPVEQGYALRGSHLYAHFVGPLEKIDTGVGANPRVSLTISDGYNWFTVLTLQLTLINELLTLTSWGDRFTVTNESFTLPGNTPEFWLRLREEDGSVYGEVSTDFVSWDLGTTFVPNHQQGEDLLDAGWVSLFAAENTQPISIPSVNIPPEDGPELGQAAGSGVGSGRVFAPTMEMVWDTTLVAGDQVVRLGAVGNVDCFVDWGDGSPLEHFTTNVPSHTYVSHGTYTVRMSGSANQYNSTFGGAGVTRGRLVSVDGLASFGSLANAFSGCLNLESFEVNFEATSGIASFSNMFRSCRSITSVPVFDTSSGTDFQNMFNSCVFLSSVPNFDMSSGTDFQNTFYTSGEIQEIFITGVTRDISIEHTNLSVTETEAFLDRLGTATEQTVTVAYHVFPSLDVGVVSDAEARGWTVVQGAELVPLSSLVTDFSEGIPGSLTPSAGVSVVDERLRLPFDWNYRGFGTTSSHFFDEIILEIDIDHSVNTGGNGEDAGVVSSSQLWRVTFWGQIDQGNPFISWEDYSNGSEGSILYNEFDHRWIKMTKSELLASPDGISWNLIASRGGGEWPDRLVSNFFVNAYSWNVGTAENFAYIDNINLPPESDAELGEATGSGVGSGFASGQSEALVLTGSASGFGAGSGNASALAMASGETFGSGLGSGSASGLEAPVDDWINLTHFTGVLDTTYTDSTVTTGKWYRYAVAGTDENDDPITLYTDWVQAQAVDVAPEGDASGSGLGSGVVSGHEILEQSLAGTGVGTGSASGTEFVTLGMASGSGVGSGTISAISIDAGALHGTGRGFGSATGFIALVIGSASGSGTGSATAQAVEAVIVGAATGSSVGEGLAQGIHIAIGTAIGSGSGSGSASAHEAVVIGVAAAFGVGAGSVAGQVETYGAAQGSGEGQGTVQGNEFLVVGEATGSGVGTGSASGAAISAGAFHGTARGFGSASGFVAVVLGEAAGSGLGAGEISGLVRLYGQASGSGVGAGEVQGFVSLDTGQASGSGVGAGTVSGISVDLGALHGTARGFGSASGVISTILGQAEGSGQGSATASGYTIVTGGASGSGTGSGQTSGVLFVVLGQATGSGVGSGSLSALALGEAALHGTGRGFGSTTGFVSLVLAEGFGSGLGNAEAQGHEIGYGEVSGTSSGLGSAVGEIARVIASAQGSGTSSSQVQGLGKFVFDSHAISHIAGDIASPTNALGPPDGVWTTNSGNQSWDSRFEMATLTIGQILYNTQEISVRARKSNGLALANPTLTAELWENGSFVSTLFSSQAISNTTSQDVVGTFEAEEISNDDDVEIRLIATGVGTLTQATIHIDAITWTTTVAGIPSFVRGASGSGFGTGEVNATLSLVIASSTGSGVGSGSVSGHEITSGEIAGSGAGSGQLTGYLSLVPGEVIGSGIGFGSVFALAVGSGQFHGTARGSGSATGAIVLVVGQGDGSGVGLGSLQGVEIVFGAAEGSGVGSSAINTLITLFGQTQGSGVGLGSIQGTESLTNGEVTGSGSGSGIISGVSISTGSFHGASRGFGSVSGELSLIVGEVVGGGAGLGEVTGHDIIFAATSGSSQGTGEVAGFLFLVVGKATGSGVGSGSISASSIGAGVFYGTARGFGSTTGFVALVLGEGSGSGEGSGFAQGLPLQFGSAAGSGVGSGQASGIIHLVVGSVEGSGEGFGAAVAHQVLFGEALGSGSGVGSASGNIALVVGAVFGSGFGVGTVSGTSVDAGALLGTGRGFGSTSGVISLITGEALATGLGFGSVSGHIIIDGEIAGSGHGLGQVAGEVSQISGQAEGGGLGSGVAAGYAIYFGGAKGSGAGTAIGSGNVSLVVAEATGSGFGSGEIQSLILHRGNIELSGEGRGFVDGTESLTLASLTGSGLGSGSVSAISVGAGAFYGGGRGFGVVAGDIALILGQPSGSATGHGGASAIQIVSGQANGSAEGAGLATGLISTLTGGATGFGSGSGTVSAREVVSGVAEGQGSGNGTASGLEATFSSLAGSGQGSGQATGHLTLVVGEASGSGEGSGTTDAYSFETLTGSISGHGSGAGEIVGILGLILGSFTHGSGLGSGVCSGAQFSFASSSGSGQGSGSVDASYTIVFGQATGSSEGTSEVGGEIAFAVAEALGSGHGFGSALGHSNMFFAVAFGGGSGTGETRGIIGLSLAQAVGSGLGTGLVIVFEPSGFLDILWPLHYYLNHHSFKSVARKARGGQIEGIQSRSQRGGSINISR